MKHELPPPLPFLLAHSSDAGISDEIHAALLVGHRGHSLNHSFFPGRLGSPGRGLLLHSEVFPGRLQVCPQCICCSCSALFFSLNKSGSLFRCSELNLLTAGNRKLQLDDLWEHQF